MRLYIACIFFSCLIICNCGDAASYKPPGVQQRNIGSAIGKKDFYYCNSYWGDKGRDKDSLNIDIVFFIPEDKIIDSLSIDVDSVIVDGKQLFRPELKIYCILNETRQDTSATYKYKEFKIMKKDGSRFGRSDFVEFDSCFTVDELMTEINVDFKYWNYKDKANTIIEEITEPNRKTKVITGSGSGIIK